MDDVDVRYFVDMKEALSELKINSLAAAQNLYEGLHARYPNRAMVAFRLADTHEIKEEYTQSLQYCRKTESLLEVTGSTKTEAIWIKQNLPMKIAYVQWQLGDLAGAHVSLSEAYPRLKGDLDESLRRIYRSRRCRSCKWMLV